MYNNADDETKANLQENYDTHLSNKDLVREMKENLKKKAENQDEFCCSVFDFQRVLPCPNSDTSLLYYKRNLLVHDFTFYDMGSRNAICCMWHEGVAGRELLKWQLV